MINLLKYYIIFWESSVAFEGVRVVVGNEAKGREPVATVALVTTSAVG